MTGLVNYCVELPTGTPEQFAKHGPGWTDLVVRAGTSDVDVIRECWIDDVYRVRAIELGPHGDEIVIKNGAGEEVERLWSKPAGVVVDLGANTGIFSALCLQFGAARVVAVEPEPANVALLRRNTEVFGDRVTIIEAAVGATHRLVGFEGGEGTGHTVDVPWEGRTVGQYTLAEILDRVDGPIALLKCDIEGGEFDALGACPSEQLARVDRIHMEWHGEREAPHLGPDDGRYGALMTHLAHTHAVEVFGRPDIGGYLFAHSYE